MVRLVYRDAILIDTSAVIALEDPSDRHHDFAKDFYTSIPGSIQWYSVNVTAHETYTRVRYNNRSVEHAIESYDFLRTETVNLLSFGPEDEAKTLELLLRYDDQKLSFHDVLCASVMLRIGILKIFTFDKDFHILGFQVVPGIT